MKSDLECLVCMLKQAMNTARIATNDPALQKKIMDCVAEQILKTDLDVSPAVNSKAVYEIVSRVTGVKDPFKQIKQQTNHDALKLMPQLMEMTAGAEDPLHAALHIAAAGNIIDLGIGHEYDLTKDIADIMKAGFSIDHYDRFMDELKPGKKLLYLGDNSGEIVFDRVLIEALLKHHIDITFSVKSGPVINDATFEDVETAGLVGLVNVIKTGSDDIGVNFSRASTEFIKAFDSADIIISKGQGNFETCASRPRDIFFLLKAKCNVVAKELGGNEGTVVFKYKPHNYKEGECK